MYLLEINGPTPSYGMQVSVQVSVLYFITEWIIFNKLLVIG